MKKLLLFTVVLAVHTLVFSQSYVPGRMNTKMKITPKVPILAYTFNLQDVTILDGPFKTAMEADSRYLLTIEPDRLLADFREHAGLKAKGARYGGWEHSGLAGHTLGHYLSACAMQYAATSDKRFLDKVNYIVQELDECQKSRKTGYLGAIPGEDSVWSQVAAGKIRSRGFDLNGGWSPWYTVHKIMAGLLDAYLYCDNKEALVIEKKMADWTGATIKHLPDSLIQKMLLCEYGGMNEVLVNTYALTADKKYLALSYKFHDARILDSLAAQLDVLPGKHSNTQIPKVIGCIRRYELTGKKKDSVIAGFFWNTVTAHHSYAPGGNSNYEYLGAPDKLNDYLTDNTMETCNTYNMLKLTRHLFELHPDAHFMDFYERALTNHILASQNHQDGMMCYFVPLRMGTRKEFSDSFNTFTCCVGSGMENHVKYGESIYFEGADGSLYVNLFIPSRLQWRQKNATIIQTSEGDNVSFIINIKTTTSFPLRIRKPRWVQSGMLLTVNGKAQPLTTAADGYITINRKWNDGDKVDFMLPKSVYAEAMPDNPGRVAFFYGPTLLAGVLGDKEPDPVTGIPVLVTADKNAANWIKQDAVLKQEVVLKQNAVLTQEALLKQDETVKQDLSLDTRLVFHTTNVGQPNDLTLIPFNAVQKEYYSVYWDNFTPDGWATQQEKYAADKKRQQQIEASTVDMLRVGEMQPERDHNFTGDKTNTGEDHLRKWRVAEEGGYLSFTMKTDPAAINSLLCTYWGMDNRYRKFDILVDGVKVATEDLNKYKESRFYELVYQLPAALTKGKKQVTITMKGGQHNSAGPVYGTIRMMKE
jgi:DUF1680 family protein